MFKSNKGIIGEADEETQEQQPAPSTGPRVALKFLVTNNLAGAIIGEGGQYISTLQEETGCRIRVALSTDLFPGTQERVVLITGTESKVTYASSRIIERAVEVEPQRTDGTLTVKILIPSPASGLIIGKGGANMKILTDESGARVHLNPKNEAAYTAERVMTITGTFEMSAKCITLVIARLLEDSTVGTYQNMTTSYSRLNVDASMGMGMGVGMGAMQMGPGGRGQGPVPDGFAATTTIHMEVPDDLVGNILGKRGVTIAEIQSLSGAKVSVSPRGEFVAGTNNRIVSIVGTFQSAQMAQFFINNKLKTPAPATSRPRGGRGGAGGRGPRQES